MFRDHFLDANILVGSRIDWDKQHNLATKYMAVEGLKKHTSKRVYNESKGVFERTRRLILSYLKKFYEEFSVSSNPLRIDQIIKAFTKKFADKFEEKEQNILNSFVERNFGDIRNIALGGEKELGDFKKVVIDTFKNALNSIDRDCVPDSKALIYRYDGCPLTYYTKEYIKLSEVINYENDILVLLDSYFIKNKHIINNICFVTTDYNHILKNKSEIEKVLNGISLMCPD
ncbi:MAG: hypothetical protein FIA99_19405 [Ruminiclostridium sp.]|nr:hypothetical protein [Ruminiclostridium sp.]